MKQQPKEGRRLRRYKIDINNLAWFFKQDSEISYEVIEGIPEGAKLLSFQLDQNNNQVAFLVVEHLAFGVVYEGNPIPVKDLIITTKK